jgi:hypothetical protein
MEHIPYSTGLAPANFYAFPQMKSALKGRRFRDDTEIIKNATEELKRISQNIFQEGFRKLNSHWQKCRFAKGNYFEEILLTYLRCFVFPRNKVIPGIF